jgi:DNA-binding response OmpR family regulator
MTEFKVLIVEDMALTALEIKQTLLKMGYPVTDIVNSFSEALESIRKIQPDIILLDIDLKGEKTGIDLAKVIQNTTSIPFIYLTSDSSEETMIDAAHTNPSAYLSKPFRAEELQSNLMICLHKRVQNTLQALGNGYFYDAIGKNIYLKDTPILLSHNEQLLIDILVNAKGQIVPFNIVEEHIWKSHPPSAENTLRNLIYRLRTKLSKLTIETVPTFGYKLILGN